jgi:hypothetical protein
MSVEQGEVFEREAAIGSIVQSFRDGQWQVVLNRESVGGNAGSNQAAINAVANRRTGEIRAFGNFRDLDQSVVKDPQNTEVTFIYNAGNVLQRMLGTATTFEPGRFVNIKTGDCSEVGAANLHEAVRRFNEEHARDQQESERNRGRRKLP